MGGKAKRICQETMSPRRRNEVLYPILREASEYTTTTGLHREEVGTRHLGEKEQQPTLLGNTPIGLEHADVIWHAGGESREKQTRPCNRLQPGTES